MKVINNVNLDNGIRYDLGYSHDYRYETFEYDYYSLDAFLKNIVTLPINRHVFKTPASNYKSESFSGTKSFEEAWNLCRFTQDEGFREFMNGLNSIRFKKSDTEFLKKNYSVVGYSPNVAKFLNGNPINMQRVKNDIKKEKITVLVEGAYSSETSLKQVFNRGICIINLIEYLEKNGFQVCLKTYTNTVEGNQKIIIKVPIKRDDERLNIKVAYFPLVNPSFERRLMFRAIEIIDGLNEAWAIGYGYPYKLNDREILRLENTIYISTPIEMEITGFNLHDDFDAFIKYIDEKYNLNEMMKGEDDLCRKRAFGKKV